MRNVITTVAALAVLAFVAPAQAAVGTFDLGWDACGPTNTSIASIAPGTTAVTMYATVLGHSEPHKAYDFQVIYGNATSRTFPDAWAFDAAGCQGTDSPPTLSHLGSKACPSFQGALQSVQIKDVSKFPSGGLYETTFMRISLANAYPNMGAGNTTQVDPNIRYFLGSVLFNHQYSVNGPTTPGTDCGGLETPICFATISASYVTVPAGETTPFGLGGNRGLTVVTQAGCPASPVKNATWGQIKSQYRL